jgi:hypothetical protein
MLPDVKKDINNKLKKFSKNDLLADFFNIPKFKETNMNYDAELHKFTLH